MYVHKQRDYMATIYTLSLNEMSVFIVAVYLHGDFVSPCVAIVIMPLCLNRFFGWPKIAITLSPRREGDMCTSTLFYCVNKAVEKRCKCEQRTRKMDVWIYWELGETPPKIKKHLHNEHWFSATLHVLWPHKTHERRAGERARKTEYK